MVTLDCFYFLSMLSNELLYSQQLHRFAGRSFLHLDAGVNSTTTTTMMVRNFFKFESKCAFLISGAGAAFVSHELLRDIDGAILRLQRRRMILLWPGSGSELQSLRCSVDHV